MRSPKETDDILFNLDRAYMLLSNKPLPSEHRESWLKALRHLPTNHVLDAIDKHINGDSGAASQYAPKPKHIIDLANDGRDRLRGFESKQPEVPCNPRIAKAWVMYMKEALGFECIDNNPDVKLTRDEMIEIVNQQASKYNQPDAIADEYKLPKYFS